MSGSDRVWPEPSPHAAQWGLEPGVAFLNHGSFGACPLAVLERQQELRRRMELDPVRFFAREVPPLLDQSRWALAELLSVETAEVVFVRNATSGVNSVLRSLEFKPGDELLVTDHAYNACRNVVRYVAERVGATVVTASLPLPIASPDEVLEKIMSCVTGRTRLALVDHVASPTAVVFPIERLVEELDRRGVDTLVDGAHAPGMLPLDLGRIGAAYYVGHCHKWLCAPKGAGFLHVRRDRQQGVQPAVISHGFNIERPDLPRLHVDFDWTGTDDPTPWLCVAAAIRFLDSLTTDGLAGLMERNHHLANDGRRVLLEALNVTPPCPETMLGSMAAVPLADDAAQISPAAFYRIHPLQTQLLDEFNIEVPIYHWPAPPRRLLRISAHAYNDLSQYQQLADLLPGLLRQG